MADQIETHVAVLASDLVFLFDKEGGAKEAQAKLTCLGYTDVAAFSRSYRGHSRGGPRICDLRLWSDFGLTLKEFESGERQPQPIEVELLGAYYRDCDDPDWKVTTEYRAGVRIGVGVDLPRTPSIFEEKRKPEV